MRPDWTDLPLNTLPIISEKACSTNLQYLNFRMVCKTWGSAVFPRPQHLRQGPWLMLPRPPKDVCHDMGIDPSDLSFYDLFTSQTHQFHLPIISDKYICGSSRGWLALEHDHRVTLLNPITGSSIALPSFERTILRVATSKRKRSVHANQHEQYTLCVYKVTFSCNPSEPGCVVVAWFLSSDWDLGFCRIGDTHWTGLKKQEHFGSGLLDFICHNNMVYTINKRKEVSVYDIQDLSVRKFSSKINFNGLYDQVNLVEGGAVSGEPFVVIKTEYHGKTKVVVRKWFGDRKQWRLVRDIGKRVVFLSRSHCISMHSMNMQLEEQGERRRESEIFYCVRCPQSIESFKVGINRVNLESGTDVPHNPSPLEVFSSVSGYGMWFTPSLI